MLGSMRARNTQTLHPKILNPVTGTCFLPGYEEDRGRPLEAHKGYVEILPRDCWICCRCCAIWCRCRSCSILGPSGLRVLGVKGFRDLGASWDLGALEMLGASGV